MEIVSHSVIQSIVAARNATLAQVQKAAEHLSNAQTLMTRASQISRDAHQGTSFTLNDRTRHQAYQDLFHNINPTVSYDIYRKQLDASIWMHLITVTGMNSLMDRTARDELYQSLCEEVPEVTVETALAMFQGLVADSGLIFQRGLARSFIELDRRFKSHDAFKIGSRIILTNVFNDWGSWNYHSRTFEVLQDVERVFAVLDGKQPNAGDMRAKIDQDRGQSLSPRQSVTETNYFRIKTYKNGNAHLWFTRDDLVDKANHVLADYYGEVFPDAVEKTNTPTPQDMHSKFGALSTNLQFYRTPDAAVQFVLHQSNIYTPKRQSPLYTPARVLEPSAGDGAFVRELLKMGLTVDAIEVDPTRAQAMTAEFSHSEFGTQLSIQCANFLTQHPRPVYDYVVMNPPFSGTHWIEHVMHAFDFLRSRGTLIAVLPATAEVSESPKHEAFRTWAQQFRRYGAGNLFRSMPCESFAESGTRVSTVILTLQHP